MRVLVCGGRGLDREEVHHDLERVAIEHFPRTATDQYGNYLFEVEIIAGGAPGADHAAIDWAIVNWCPFKEFHANWQKHGKAAGPIRNQQMLDEGKPDLVVAFPGGRGTADMVRRSKEAGVKVIEVSVNG
jgi:SLOG family YspA-like protein